MGIFSAIFGGGTSSASQASQDATIAANAATQKFIEERSGQARADVLSIFPQAQQFGAQGFQGALDVISGGIPQQLAAFQGGNVGAQQTLGQTLPQVQNAILGLPVNQAAFQPQQLSPDLSFISNLNVPTVSPLTAQQPTGGRFSGALTQIGGGGFDGGGRGGRRRRF